MGRFWGPNRWGATALWLCAWPAFGQAREVAPPPDGARGHFEVALHARSTQAMARAERAAWLTVSLPLDRAAVPRVAERPSVPSPPSSAPGSSAPGSSAPGSSAPPSPSSAPAPATAPARVSFQQLRSLAEFSRRATAVALAVVGTAAERRRLDSLSSRARSSALLPELRLRVLRNSDKALRWIPTTDDPYRITQADGTGLVLEGAATFRLDRLLFAHEELAVERLRLDAGTARLKLEARVVEALLGLFRARELACRDDGDDAERVPHAIRVLELLAELDGLTAGWFSEQAPGFGRAVWGFPEAALGVCSPPEPAPAATPGRAAPEPAGVAGTIPVARPASSE